MLHAIFNRDLRQLASVRDPAQKLTLLTQNPELRCVSDRSIAMTVPRLCSTCTEQGRKTFSESDKRGDLEGLQFTLHRRILNCVILQNHTLCC